MGRWLWRGPANSDGADDGATDQWAAGETRQIPGVGPRRQTVGLGSAEQPKGSATWGSDCAAPGPRPPAGGDQQASCDCKQFLGEAPEPGSRPEPPERRGGEGTGEGWLQPLRKNSLCSTLPKSEHLRDRRPHNAGAGETRPGTALCVPTAELGSSECRRKAGREGFKLGSLLLTHAGQVRDSGTPRGGDSPWPHPLRAAYLSGAWRLGRPAPSGRSERAGPPPAYKSGAALQLAQFSLRPVTRTLRETHHPDSPW